MSTRPDPDLAASALVGREREQAALRAALYRACAGHGGLVLISGEAGIGKTALAETLAAEATALGARVLVGRCYDLSETPPYGPWAEAFAFAGPATAALAPPDLTGGGAGSQATLFAQVRDFLAALASQQPLMVLLDDLHWADPASLDLLRVVARQLAALPILVLITYRSDELTRRHPLAPVLPLLVREAHGVRIELHPLDEAGLGALVGHYALPPADVGRLVAYLHDRAEGNPFFAGELLRTLEEEGGLRQSGGGWALGDLGAVGVPPLLRHVIDARVDRLGETTRDLLTAAAVIGQTVPLPIWQAVTATDEAGLLRATEQATEARLLTETPAGASVRFAHALIREALYESLLGLRRRLLHRRAGEALATTAAPDPDAVAYHFRQADDPRALDWLLRAADRAHAVAARDTATERVEAALQLLERTGAPPAERGWLLCRLGALWSARAPARALAALEAAVELAQAAGDAQLAAAVGELQGVTHCYSGALRRGLAELEAAVATDPGLLPTDGPARLAGPQLRQARAEGGYHGDLALWLANAGRYAALPALVARVVAVEHDGVVTHRPLAEVAPALLALGRAHAALGMPDKARQTLAQARARYAATGVWGQALTALADEVYLVALPYAADAPAALATLVESARRFPMATAFLANAAAVLQAPLLLLAGRWTEASATAETLLRDIASSSVPAAHLVATLGRLARAQGDGARLNALVQTVLPEGPATEPGDSAYRAAVELQRLSAELAIEAGDLPAARTWLEAHDRWLNWAGVVLWQAEARLAWAAYYRASGDLAKSCEHADAALAYASAPRQPLALLAAHRLLGELATTANQYAEAATHLTAALALADACAAPYERALCLLALAELRAATDDRDGALAVLAEARAILEPLGANPALARADALAERLAATVQSTTQATYPAGLSAREVEVLRLVAQGLSDAQVAERLYLSPRTVSTHLRAIYNKLGVDNRTAAARLATAQGLV